LIILLASIFYPSLDKHQVKIKTQNYPEKKRSNYKQSCIVKVGIGLLTIFQCQTVKHVLNVRERVVI